MAQFRILLFVVVAGLLLMPSAAEAGLGPYHEDDRVGFKIRPPADWSFVAMRADEKWVVGKFTSPRTYTFNDKEFGTMDHRPHMTAITFVESVVKKKGIEKTEDDDGTITLEFNNPFKDYKDYLKRTYSGGGWFVSAEEEGEHKGIPVTRMEIKVEKLTHDGPKRLITWIYHLEGVDLAVQFEVLENHYKKLKGDVTASLKSLRTITRTKSLTEETTGKREKWVDESKLSLEDRTKRRKEKEQALHNKTVKSLPDTWKVEEMGRFLVLLHGDKKFAKKIVKQADGIWKWLDKNFAFWGEDEYVPKPIVRICKDAVEERAFLGGGTTWGGGTEITTHRDPNAGAGSWEFEYVNQRMLSIWFSYRNSDAWWAAPQWLRGGLRQVIGTARLKGSRLDFKVDSWERDGLRKSVKDGDLTPPRELVMISRQEFYDNPNRTKQSAAFIRFLLASKNKKCRNVLHKYLEGLQHVTAEMAKADEDDDDDYDAPETEEEEEERMRKRSEALKEKESEFLEKVFEYTFGDWTDKDWKRLQDQYYKSMG